MEGALASSALRPGWSPLGCLRNRINLTLVTNSIRAKKLIAPVAQPGRPSPPPAPHSPPENVFKKNERKDKSKKSKKKERKIYRKKERVRESEWGGATCIAKIDVSAI